MIQPLVLSFTPESIQNKAAKAGAERITNLLKQGKLFLLLSGGSAIQMYQHMFELLATEPLDWSRLTVSLLDERYVSVADPDSNAQQLAQVGIIGWLMQHGATWVPYLVANESGEVVAERVNQKFHQLLDSGVACFIMAGIGPDGHTSGLLPTAEATTIQQVFETSVLVKYYELPKDTDNPYRLRITTTPAFMRQADEVMIYAPGAAKKAALERFLAGTALVSSCPSISLRTVSQSVTLFTDITGL